MALMRSWPALRPGRAGYGGHAMSLGTRQIVHFHHADAAEVRLTWSVIQRMADVLRESGRVTTHPGQDWVRVQLAGENDVSLLMSLLSVAIKANAHAVRQRDTDPCPYARIAATPN